MTKVVTDPREKYIKLIDTDKCRAIFQPHLVFVCGGRVDPTATTNHSIRNMFMNLSATNETNDDHNFILAENFKDWKDGYHSLSEFENDIAHISSMVVVFLESEGALTEFGLFYANKLLRERLVVVLHSKYYESESFIKFGLLNPLESLDERLVRAYDINHKDIENVRKDEIVDIVTDLSDHCNTTNRSEKFDLLNRGHIIFLTFQLIDIFLALTIVEIHDYLKLTGVQINRRELTSALFILKKFRLIGSKKESSQTFYFAFTNRTERVELHLRAGEPRIDKTSLKIQVSEFYRSSTKQNSSFRNRVNLNYSSVWRSFACSRRIARRGRVRVVLNFGGRWGLTFEARRRRWPHPSWTLST